MHGNTRRYYNESINKSLLDKLNLPEPERVPADSNIVKMLVKTFRDTYENSLHPYRLNNRPKDRNGNYLEYRESDDTFGFYNEQNISDTYKVFYEVLELMKKSYLERPKEPFPEVDQILADALANAIPENPPPASTPSRIELPLGRYIRTKPPVLGMRAIVPAKCPELDKLR